MTCLPGSAGLVAIILGLLARQEIRRSHGARKGALLASTGLVLGLMSVAATIVAMVWLGSLGERPPAIAARRGAARRTAPMGPPPAASPRPLPHPRAAKTLGARPTETVHIGEVLFTDLGTDIQTLRRALSDQRALAARDRRRLLLWVSSPDCSPCDGVAAAMLDRRMQSAMSEVLVVRVDVVEHGAELRRLGVPTESIPGFALLDASNRPVDYLHGGEWDADVAANIAPVLGSFVRGGYVQRRHPWHSGDGAEPIPI